MRASPNIHLLAQLHLLRDQDAQRAAFRRGMADLAAMGGSQQPVPLEGLEPDALALSMDVCGRQGYLDDLSFLSPETAAVALYHLASGLPKGPLRTAMGRRVMRVLVESDARTFANLAATLAVAGRDPFSNNELRARAALTLELPSSEFTAADSLALALLARPQMLYEWVIRPSKRSLPERQLAARILERAARQAARLCSQGDDAALELFRSPAVNEVWLRLLADRESLVWRHVAIARGFLSTVMHEYSGELASDLDPGLSPTEWRRAAVSVVVAALQRDDAAIRHCNELLHGPLPKRDHGLLGVMVYGVDALAESEPKLAEDLLTHLVQRGEDQAMEPFVDLICESAAPYATTARNVALDRLRSMENLEATSTQNKSGSRMDFVRVALELGQAQSTDVTTTLLPLGLRLAKRAYLQHGPQAAFDIAVLLLQSAADRLTQLERNLNDNESMRWLWELDRTLLQGASLSNLLQLSADVTAKRQAQDQLEQLRQRLYCYLLEQERVHDDVSLMNGTSMRRLISVLHAVDAEANDSNEKRQTEAVRVLLQRVQQEEHSILERVVCAALARAFDALIRGEVLELSDVLFAASSYVRRDAGIRILAQASMEPQAKALLYAYSDFVAAVGSSSNRAGELSHILSRLHDVVRAVPVVGFPRVEALRRALLDACRNLEVISHAPDLSYLCGESGLAAMRCLADATMVLHQLQLGTLRRVFAEDFRSGPSVAATMLAEFPATLERSLATDEPILWQPFLDSLRDALAKEIPSHVGQIVHHVLRGLQKLPSKSDTTAKLPPLSVSSPRRLPPWLPPNRIMGGFYILDTLGAGALGSVFVATRVEDKNRPGAQRFALKVPTYNAQAAGTLSESEFLAMFRTEASALLSLPHDHPNLASFVTFDAGTRPKPMLVMELVSGPTLSRLLARGQLQTANVLNLLLGVLEGLATMHALGIGHLDVKPSNIIVRQDSDATSSAVLVDFGLSGRALRPSCATAAYGAPEIWGLLPTPDYRDPRPADIYAFACTMFEVLTTREIFSGKDDMAIVAAHLRHDGRPEALRGLEQDEIMRELAQLLTQGLRQDPRDRLTALQFANHLRALAPKFEQYPWPAVAQDERDIA